MLFSCVLHCNYTLHHEILLLAHYAHCKRSNEALSRRSGVKLFYTSTILQVFQVYNLVLTTYVLSSDSPSVFITI